MYLFSPYQDARNSSEIQCTSDCEALLDEDQLIKGETYEARLRVQAVAPRIESAWSEWSSTASWVSLIGKIKPSEKGDQI